MSASAKPRTRVKRRATAHGRVHDAKRRTRGVGVETVCPALVAEFAAALGQPSQAGTAASKARRSTRRTLAAALSEAGRPALLDLVPGLRIAERHQRTNAAPARQYDPVAARERARRSRIRGLIGSAVAWSFSVCAAVLIVAAAAAGFAQLSPAANTALIDVATLAHR